MPTRLFPLYVSLACIFLLTRISSVATESTADRGGTQPANGENARSYQTLVIEGWQVHVNDLLLKDEKVATDKALALLTEHLKEIVRAVPAPAVAHLRKIPLWFNPAYPGVAQRAEYHPSGDWLKAQKRNPAMAKCVEFTNISIFEPETKRMPCFVLHELAHGYHDQVLSFEQPEIIAAYKKALESKSYDHVQRWHGVPGRITTERAYAMTNHKEYFAEDTEAYFGRNDFFPFTRDELEKHDPDMFNLLKRVWGLPEAAKLDDH